MRFTGSCPVCGQTYPLGFPHNCPGRWVVRKDESEAEEPIRRSFLPPQSGPLADIDPAELLKAWEFYQAHNDRASVKPVAAKRQINAAQKKARAEYQKRWRQERTRNKDTAS